MATAQDLIEAAHREIGVLAASETLSAQEATDSLARLNRWLNAQAANNLTIYTITRDTKTLTPSQSSYTVGTGGDISIARPVFIDRVTLLDRAPTTDVEYSLGDLLTEQEWQGITLKDLTAEWPQRAYYNPTYPLGRITLWPIPTGSNLSLVIYHWTAVTQFAALSTTVSLPPGYEECIVQNLALLLCPSYERNPHPVLVKSAADAMATVKRANKRLSDRTFGADVLAHSGGYSIYTDR